MDKYERMEIGRQAEEFLQYIEEKPYFEEMIERMRLGLMAEMCSLRSNQKDEWAVLSDRFHFLAEIVNMARGDVFIGREAYESENGLKRVERPIL
jgi:hypothetical protein